MARRPLRLTRAALLGLAATGTTGCGSSPVPGPSVVVTSTGPSSAVASATSRTPAADAVALSVVRAWVSYDTVLDRRPNDTARRLAMRWLTPPLRRQVAGFTGPGQVGAEWAEWTRRHARATVTVRLANDDRPPDTDTLAYRQVDATITMRGDAGWAHVQRQTAFVQLTAVSGQWLVADLRSVNG